MARPLVYSFSPSYYVRCYQMAQAGTPREAMAELLGVHSDTFRRWYRENPHLREAINAGRKVPDALSNAAGQTFEQFVAGRLPDELLPLWQELNSIFQVPYDETKDTAKTIETLFAGRGERARQMIFIHSLAACNFNKTEACRRVNVTTSTFRVWCKEKAFRDLVAFVLGEVRKDFFESLLVRSALAGSDAAIIFANKTLNADRGYGVKVQVNHSGVVGHLHENVDTDDLSDLPIEIQSRAVALAEDIAAFRASGKLPPKPVQALPAHDEEAA